MKWLDIDEMAAGVPLPKGYRFELLKRCDISEVVDSIKEWFPDISVGSASVYLRGDFFGEKVSLVDEADKDVLVVLLRAGHSLAGLFSCERDLDTLSLYGRLVVVAPKHRGVGLCRKCIMLAELIGQRIGMGMIYGMATLKIPNVQLAFEALGWRLIGIAPGYDREMVAPGVVKRVYEAVYAKVLVSECEMLRPQTRNLTRGTRRIFCQMFPDQLLAQGGD
ncbi:hypothetical protein AB3X96_39095 [Paraburkholderia sp. BR13439]|uniref:hypothetical protein n=1 Tax=unclassified Paraburkholderia TaxID=2615204 RepID=UPI0034CD183B